MDNFIRTYENFAFCFKKIDYFSEYLKIDEEERTHVCASEKSRFLEALNSEDMKLSSFVKLRIENLKSNIIS